MSHDNLTTRKNNALTQAEASRLYRWLEESRIYASTATARKLAELSTVELKFTVTPSNVLSAKRALKIVKPPPVQPHNSCRCRELAAALVVLFKQAHATPPPCVLEIAGAPGRIITSAPQAESLPFPMAGVGAGGAR